MRIGKQVTLAVFFAIVGIALTACDNGTGSDTGSGTNIGEKIIGTWIDQYRRTWVFNADGNFTRSTPDEDFKGISKFGVADAKLCLAGDTPDSYYITYDIYISPNGKTLILSGGEAGCFTLTKQ